MFCVSTIPCWKFFPLISNQNQTKRTSWLKYRMKSNIQKLKSFQKQKGKQISFSNVKEHEMFNSSHDTSQKLCVSERRIISFKCRCSTWNPISKLDFYEVNNIECLFLSINRFPFTWFVSTEHKTWLRLHYSIKFFQFWT